MIDTAILTLAYILDLIIGDPGWLPHPVRIIGWLIEKMEQLLKGENVKNVIPAKAGIQKKELDSPVKPGNDDFIRKEMIVQLKDKLSGIILVMIIVASSYSIFHALDLLVLTSHFSLLTSYLLFAMLVFLTSTTLATNDLIKSGKAVIDAVNTGDKESAREKLSFIVGRDTGQLDNKGIAKATIETLAENTSDGIIAPLFYLAIGGLPLAMTYKAINTLDSMVGYRNEKYKNFGWASAKLDDIVNYIPARITGMLIFVATLILSCAGKIKDGIRTGPVRSNGSNGLSSLNCFKIMLRDGRRHLSPNSGIPEAAMAGALGVRLGGPSFYGGIMIEKPYIGEEVGANGRSPVQGPDELLNASEKAISIVKITSVLGLVFALIFMYLRIAICCR